MFLCVWCSSVVLCAATCTVKWVNCVLRLGCIHPGECRKHLFALRLLKIASDKSLHQMLSGQFIQPSGSPATEVMTFSLPQYCLPWLSAVAHYLKQNLLIFLHVPKYTDMNTAHHFKVQPNISPHAFSLILVFKSLIIPGISMVLVRWAERNHVCFQRFSTTVTLCDKTPACGGE